MTDHELIEQQLIEHWQRCEHNVSECSACAMLIHLQEHHRFGEKR